MRRLFGAALPAMFALGACAAYSPHSAPAGAAAEKTVYVTRHLQKADGEDPSLSPEGAKAAERLADALDGKGISAIFATPTRRAMETAAPLAQRIGVRIKPYDPRNAQLLTAEVAATPGAVLVVGHSNTVHDLVARFGARTPPEPLTEQDYGTVFIVDAEGGVETFEID